MRYRSGADDARREPSRLPRVTEFRRADRAHRDRVSRSVFLVRKVVERVERAAPGDTSGDQAVIVLLEPIANGTVTDAQLAEPPGRWDVDPRFKTTPWLKLATPARAVR